jgi:hypothetical protein
MFLLAEQCIVLQTKQVNGSFLRIFSGPEQGWTNTTREKFNPSFDDKILLMTT